MASGADLAKIADSGPPAPTTSPGSLGVCAQATARPRGRVRAGIARGRHVHQGALGAVSRVCPAFRINLTFAVVPDEHGEGSGLRPGQLSMQDVRRCLELLRV